MKHPELLVTECQLAQSKQKSPCVMTESPVDISGDQGSQTQTHYLHAMINRNLRVKPAPCCDNETDLKGFNFPKLNFLRWIMQMNKKASPYTNSIRAMKLGFDKDVGLK